MKTLEYLESIESGWLEENTLQPRECIHLQHTHTHTRGSQVVGKTINENNNYDHYKDNKGKIALNV